MKHHVTALCLASLLSVAVTEAAAEGTLGLELNNAVNHDSVCRLSFMVHNGLDVQLETLGLEVVLLDKQGLAQDFLMLRSGNLPTGKRRVRQFDLPDVNCNNLGEVLINDVAECTAEGLDANGCLAILTPSSRIAIKLGL
ncbi:hypothetical protein [uncultured Cohaesibacter sp.]|uniref:hypothetical protein n=1 Tax=uncultured Cohaesibacter sp. TaxID=1002546 RepID=UPI0029C6AFA0|nr:hypothetical protein [uncultured Cohaesibacter sp.]